MTPLRAFNETLLFYCPRFNGQETAVLRAAYDALLTGAPVSATDLSQQVGMSLQALDDHLARWPGLVMSFVTAHAPSGNCVGVCCPDVHFLRSTETGAQWQASNPMGSVLTMQEAWGLAQFFVDARLLAADVAAPHA